MVVDDLDINREFLRSFLRHLGYRIVVASNGLEAVEEVRKEKFDLILMDLEMPIMDGYESIRIIRKEQGLAPFIAAVTCLKVGDVEQFCDSSGADSYLPKPISLNDVKELIRQTVSRLQPETPQSGAPLESFPQTEPPRKNV